MAAESPSQLVPIPRPLLLVAPLLLDSGRAYHLDTVVVAAYEMKVRSSSDLTCKL